MTEFDSIKDLLLSLEKDFIADLVVTIRRDFVNDFVNIFSMLYERHFGALGEEMDRQGDPTSPNKLKPAVISHVRSEAARALNEMRISASGEIDFSILTYAGFGYPGGIDPKEQDKVRLFFFYLEGVGGEFAFISSEFFAEYIAPTSGKDEVGRFGEGYLMSREEYEKRYSTRKKRSRLKQLPNFEEVRSPISGTPPSPLLDELSEETNKLMDKYIRIAENMAFE